VSVPEPAPAPDLAAVIEWALFVTLPGVPPVDRRRAQKRLLTVLAGWVRQDDAEEALGRVRALHRPRKSIGGWSPDGTAYLGDDECSHDALPWPCPTLRALDGDGA
jgi:hypothetical protein